MSKESHLAATLLDAMPGHVPDLRQSAAIRVHRYVIACAMQVRTRCNERSTLLGVQRPTSGASDPLIRPFVSKYKELDLR